MSLVQPGSWASHPVSTQLALTVILGHLELFGSLIQSHVQSDHGLPVMTHNYAVDLLCLFQDCYQGLPSVRRWFYQGKGTDLCHRFFRGQERVIGCPGRDVVTLHATSRLRCWLWLILDSCALEGSCCSGLLRLRRCWMIHWRIWWGDNHDLDIHSLEVASLLVKAATSG